MWETIGNVLTSGNAIAVMICIIVLLILFIVMVKLDIIKIKTKHVSTGNDDERDIIRQQIEFSHDYIMSLEHFVNDIINQDLNEYYTKYILEVLYDEVVKYITYNHLSINNAYIKVKANSIFAIVCTLTELDAFKTEAFKKQIHEWLKDLIGQLIEIREMHK